jgi:predicted ATPase
VAQIGATIGREFSHSLLALVVRKPEAELASALNRIVKAGLLFQQGVPPHATYLFKYSLVQDTAYGTLLREPRRALHARIAETLESQFTDIAESQPELLARHCTEAGLIEKAAGFWGKAGQRSLERSALVEAIEQFTRASSLLKNLPSAPALRREAIKLKVALITPLVHVKGYAAPETKAAVEQAHLLIKQTEAFGERPDDPLLSFTVLYAFWAVNYVAFNGDVMRDLATQFVALAEKQRENALNLIGHRLVGTSLLYTGNIVESRSHLDRAIELYDPQRASSACNAIRTRHRSARFMFSVYCSVDIRFVVPIELFPKDHSRKHAMLLWRLWQLENHQHRTLTFVAIRRSNAFWR